MNNYIVTGKGFLKEIERIEQENSPVLFIPKFTRNLILARKLNTKTANKIIEKYKLDAFIWKPLEEFPILDAWEVRRMEGENDWSFKTLESNVYFKAVRVQGVYRSDKDELIGNNNTYFTEAEANKLAQEKNLEMLKNLKTKININHGNS